MKLFNCAKFSKAVMFAVFLFYFLAYIQPCGLPNFWFQKHVMIVILPPKNKTRFVLKIPCYTFDKKGYFKINL